MQNKNRLEDDSVIIQTQIAGNNSSQLQIGKVIVNQGFSEEKIREIFNYSIKEVIEEYSNEANNVALERINRLEEIVIPRISAIDGAISLYADPYFQFLLRKAQISAAKSDNEDDYAILSELIACHVNSGIDRLKKTAISKAVEIVGDVDSEALCALTVYLALFRVHPVSGSVKEGVCAFNNVLKDLLYMDLPVGQDWTDHLDILGAIRMSSYGSSGSFKEIYTKRLNGYICVGIKKESKEYALAIDRLIKQRISVSCLVENELLDDYVRLSISSNKSINEFNHISQEQKEALHYVFGLYSKDQILLEQVWNRFLIIWDYYNALKTIRLWWDSVAVPFEITKVGEVLAHTNAKRCNNTFPDMF